MKTLYEEQTEARIIANRNLDNKVNSVFVSPCGTGKTVTSSAIIVDRVLKKKRIFILVPQIEIMHQWIEELVEWGIDPGYCNDEGFRGNNRSVYVCMYQSLVGKLHLLSESLYPDEIIIDETQHILCNSIMKICDYFDKATRLGLTATLYHNSGQTFRPWFTEYFQTITKAQAIKKGYITEPLLIEPENYLKDADIPILGEDYDPEFQASLLGETKIYGNIVDDYERLFNGSPVIVPCATYEQAKQVKHIFKDYGWVFEHVHSDGMHKSERKRILDAVAAQRINGICTVGIGVEGLSIKGLWGVMWMCRTKSPIRWTQFNGRGERLYDGKHYAIVVDYVGNAIIHGHPSDERKWTIDGIEVKDDEDKVPFIKCWSCGTYNNPDNLECHWCGADLSGSSEFRTICRYCSNWSKKELSCSIDEDFELYQKEEGCSGFKKRARSLPAIVDGKLVAITTDGQLHDIKQRAEEKKEEQQLRLKLEEEKRNKPEKITAFEKRKALSKGLFASRPRQSLLQEALSEWE